jgi:hypothetical protein
MTPSWDLFIILFFTIMAVYGLLLGKGRVFNLLINSFVGYVVAAELGEFVYTYLAKATEISHSFNVTLFGAKVFAFVTVVFILTLRNELSGSSDAGYQGKINTILTGILAAGFILSSALVFMGNTERFDLLNASTIANYVYDYRLIWVIGPILLIVVNAAISKFRK